MCYVTGDTVMLPVHISCDPPVGDVEERMAETITAAAKAANLAPNRTQSFVENSKALRT